MKAPGSIVLSTTLTLCLVFQVPFVDAQGAPSCTGTATVYNTPSQGSCMSTWSNGGTYRYPNDFEGILNEVTIYTCPTNKKRVIISNGIPDHDVRQMNPNSPCEIKWAVSLPLNPSKANVNTEIPVRNIIAMAINGVPAYGAQEGSMGNAVEPTGSLQDAQFWYGHADPFKAWHFHNPFLGEENPSSDTLLGYALDGFPIYGPLEDDSTLDKCNGRTDDSGNYKYHVRTKDQVDATLDYCNGRNPENNWNYILGCYSGSLSNTNIETSTNFALPDDCYVATDKNSDENEAECIEENTDKFLLKIKDGIAKYKTCKWLKKKAKKSAKKAMNTCKKNVESNDGYGPPSEVCPVTCGTCD